MICFLVAALAGFVTISAAKATAPEAMPPSSTTEQEPTFWRPNQAAPGDSPIQDVLGGIIISREIRHPFFWGDDARIIVAGKVNVFDP